MKLKSKIPVVAHAEGTIHLKDLVKLIPKMKSIHREAEIKGRELGTNIRVKPDGHLTLKRGLFFVNEDVGEEGSVEVTARADQIGDFHTHPKTDPPELSAGDICDVLIKKKYRSIECVSGGLPKGVACYRLRLNKDGSPPKIVKHLERLCKTSSDEQIKKYLYHGCRESSDLAKSKGKCNYFKILEVLADDITPPKDWSGMNLYEEKNTAVFPLPIALKKREKLMKTHDWVGMMWLTPEKYSLYTKG